MMGKDELEHGCTNPVAATRHMKKSYGGFLLISFTGFFFNGFIYAYFSDLKNSAHK